MYVLKNLLDICISVLYGDLIYIINDDVYQIIYHLIHFCNCDVKKAHRFLIQMLF